MNRRLAVAMVGLLALVFAIPAGAASVDGKGEAFIVDSQPVETPLPDGTTHVDLLSRQVLISADPSHPFHRASITCAGTCTLAAGETTGPCAGGCTGQDMDGDILNLTWDGQFYGMWTLTGGTGKWAGASGNGKWKGVGMMGAGFSRNEWKGLITMP